MSDFAFNNYCLSCNQQTLDVYCSQECKNIDESFMGENLSDYSPLIAPSVETPKVEKVDDLEYFDLNSKKDVLEMLPVTSCNYRKWISLN